MRPDLSAITQRPANSNRSTIGSAQSASFEKNPGLMLRDRAIADHSLAVCLAASRATANASRARLLCSFEHSQQLPVCAHLGPACPRLQGVPVMYLGAPSSLACFCVFGIIGASIPTSTTQVKRSTDAQKKAPAAQGQPEQLPRRWGEVSAPVRPAPSGKAYRPSPHTPRLHIAPDADSREAGAERT